MFGSTWGSAQQNTQPQQTGAFGQPSAFGSTTNNAFGSTSAFGQPQQQPQPAQQSQVNPMFGNLATPSSNTTPTGFGGFGGSNTANTGGTFGMKPATGFGAFSGGTGAFGNTTTSAFGQPATNTAGTSVFGQPAASTTSAFGGGGTSVFGGNKFGATTATTSTTPVVTTGTSNPPYTITTEKDGTTTSQYQSISCMPAYIGYSFEELRVQDYAQNRKTATTGGAFGQTAFGATQPAASNVFGAQTTQQQPASIFGGAANPTNTGFGAFGQPAATQPTTSAFGGGGTGAFGQPQQQPNAFGATNAFGQPQQQQTQPQQTSIFGGGTTAFGSTANKPAFSAFGGGGGATTNPFSSGTTAFGTQTQNPQQPAAQTTNIFGTPQPAANTQPTAFSAFGAGSNAPKPSIFGTPATTTQPAPSAFGGFGTTQQQPAQPQQNATPSIFGGGGSIFGQPQNQQQQQPAQSTSLFGGGQTTTPTLFGNTSTNTNTGLFGNTQQNQQPQQPGQTQTGTNIFGNLFTKPAQPTASLFGGGQLQTTSQPQQNSLFGNPSQTNPTTSLFGPKPSAPLLGGSLSGSQGPGLFGATASTQGAQGSLTASIAQPIGENLPIFAMLPAGPRLLDLEQSKKKAGVVVDLPLRSPLPKVAVGYNPASSKLRGFGSSPSLISSTSGGMGSSSVFLTPAKSGLNFSVAESMSSSVGPDFLGRSGSPALGSGVRHSVKVIMDKKLEPSELFVKTGSPGGLRAGRVTFSPALSVSAREKDTTVPPAPQTQESTTSLQTQPPKGSTQQPDKDKEPPVYSETEGSKDSTELTEGDYWVKPDLSALKKAGYDHLSAFEGLVVGRKGYGEVEFLEPVDLTGVPKLGALFGEVVRFDDKECSVYPDSEDVDKPPPGSGLNVKAKLSLERCWTVDKATREPILDPNHPSNVKHLKRLKNMKATHFENFDMKTGTWTFTVDHF